MDNSLDNISIIKIDNNFNYEENYPEINKKEKNNCNSPKKINRNESDFEKSLDLSNISQAQEQINCKTENDKNNIDINLSLESSFNNQNINMMDMDMKNNTKEKKNENDIRTIKTMPLKKIKIKKEDLDKIPLPIFSCIYCSNEYISFNHLSNEIISNKYLLQTSIFDLKQLDYLISFQPKIYKDNNNKLLNLFINNSEYLKTYYNIDKIKEYFNLNIFTAQCQNNELIIQKALKQRLEDIIIRKKKDYYFKEIKYINKISKNSINNKCLFNTTNSLINNYSGLNGFIGNGQATPQNQGDKNNNNQNQSNSSLLNFNSIPTNNNNNKNEIGLIGKGNNMHYMENIMEITNKNIESENTIEEKEQILDFFGENDLKRKINKNDIDWEDNYFDINNPIIDDDILDKSFENDDYELIKYKKSGHKNKNVFQTIENIKNMKTLNTLNNNNLIHNTKLAIINNNKSLASTNTSSNIMLKNSVRDKDKNYSLSLLLNGNKIVNIQNNNSTINPSNFNINLKNKLASVSFYKNKDEKKQLNSCNRTPSFTKTRIVDLCTNSEKKLINNGKNSLDLKNIHKKILFNYTANVKREILDNNITLKIKRAFHNNKRNNEIKTLYPIKNNNNNLINENEINKYNKFNLLLTKQNININNDNNNNNNNIYYNKTLFNKSSNGLKLDKINNTNNYNFHLIFNNKNNFENESLKKKIFNKKLYSLLNKNKFANINNNENSNYFNTIKNRELNINLRSLDRDKEKEKEKENDICKKIHTNHNIRKNYKSAKKVNISIPQKLLNEYNNNIQDNKIKEKINSNNKIGIGILLQKNKNKKKD